MGRTYRYPNRRYVNRRSSRLHANWFHTLLVVAIFLLTAVYNAKDSLFFNNGTGGANWKIGEPHVTLWTAQGKRSLPELSTFALELVNRDRQLNGLPPLVEDPLISQSAQLHAEDMTQRNYYAHVTPEGRTPTDRFAAVGGQGGVGENIMLQSQSFGMEAMLDWGMIEAFQKSWMYSDGHRANLLTPEYSRFGYGIMADPAHGKIYAVQNFQ